MNEEEQEKLYELLFKDTKNKLEATIEKQQKEIEELKRENEEGHKQLLIDTAEEVLKWKGKYYLLSRKIDVISKDKINDKIKEYQNKLFQDVEENKVVEYENIIQVLEELLEEN